MARGNASRALRRVCWMLLLLIGVPASASATAEEETLEATAGPTETETAPPAPAARTHEFVFDDEDDIEKLVVTAGKRRELLQDTPVSVSVISGRDLDRRGVTSLEEIGEYVPNLSAWENVQGAGTIYSRGVGQRDGLVSLDPGVGLYVDDAYVARAQGALLATMDVERIEVLRGPQGTLYGKNTIGGAVKLVTRKPGPNPEVAGSFSAGDYDTIQSTGMVNLPVVDDLLYTRFNFASRRSAGYNRNTFLRENYNDDHLLAFRGQVRLLPRDDVTLDLAGHYSNEEERGHGAKCVVSNPFLPLFVPPAVQPLYTGQHAECAAAQGGNPHDFSSNLDDGYGLESYGTSMTGTWEVGALGFVDDLEVKSVTSLREQVVNEGSLDVDATQSTFITLHQRATTDFRQSQASQEFQTTATALDDHLKLTGGVYGFWEDTDGGNVTSTSTFAGTRVERIEIANTSYAAYAQSSFAPWDWLELMAGVRYTVEQRSADRRILAGASPAERPSETESKNFRKWTPTAGLALSAPDSLLEDTPLRSGIAYFTYSQGWKSGGFSTRRNPALFRLSSFEPEEVDNFEVGLKFDALHSKLLINTSFFYSSYRKMQLTVQRVNPADPTDIGSAISNAGRATIFGFEIESVLRPWRELVARVNLGLTDAQYEHFMDVDVTNSPIDRSSEAFFNIPKWSLSTLVEYSFDLNEIGLDWGSITPAVNVSYQTDRNNHFTNEGYRSGLFRQDSLALVDVRLGWALSDGRTELAFFMNNLTDEDYYQSAIDLTPSIGTGARHYGAPRTLGGTVRYRWDSFGWGGL